jgi:hypothetical protein
VRARIDARGGVITVRALRSGNARFHAARRFGDLLVPSSVTVGWWFDTPRYAPFFRAGIDHSTQC